MSLTSKRRAFTFLSFIGIGIAVSSCEKTGITAKIRGAIGAQDSSLELPEGSLNLIVGASSELKPVLKLRGKDVSSDGASIVWSSPSDGIIEITKDDKTLATSIQGLKVGTTKLTGNYKTVEQIFDVKVVAAEVPPVSTPPTTPNNAAPTIGFTGLSSPTRVKAATGFNIQYIASDVEEDAAISIYYRFNSALNCDPSLTGWTLITDSLSISSGSAYLWDSSALNLGNVYLCAKIDDATNPPVYAASTSYIQLVDSPVLAFSYPSRAGEEAFINSSYQIQVNKDLDTSVSYYYKTSSSNCDASLNSWNLIEANVTTSQYQWDLSGIPLGSFYICAKLNDGLFDPVYLASSYPITIIDSYVLGARNTTSTRMLDLGFLYPSSVATDGAKLFVVDDGRVLIWNQIPTSTRTPPDYWLGDQNIPYSSTEVSATRFSGYGGVATDGTRLVITDPANSRVLIWNSIPSNHTVPADLVLGQPNFTSNTPNNGGISARSLSGPSAVALTSHGLIVADTNNNRLLIWSTFPTQSHQDAQIVIGQANFTSSSSGLSSTRLNTPQSVSVDENGQIAVADTGNHRVLIWTSFPTSSNAAANVVLGQADFVSNTANSGGRSARSLHYPNGVSIKGEKLLVFDGNNRRVLGWDSNALANQADATVLIGQSDFGSNSSTFLYGVAGGSVTQVNGKILIIDTLRSHLSVWNAWPSSPTLTPHIVLPTFCGIGCYTVERAGPYPHSLSYPSGLHVKGDRLYVADTNSHRVMVWREIADRMDQPADFVLGQPDFYTGIRNENTPSAVTLRSPTGVFQTDTKLVVADSGNHRVLIWNSIPDDFSVPADVVLGQPNFSDVAANQGLATSASTLNSPKKVFVHAGKLYVSDTSNHRILVWNSIPTTNNAPADFVIGQPDFTTVTSTVVAADKIKSPMGIFIEGTKLFVADSGNNRVLVWNDLPITSGVAANLAIGQATLTSGTGAATSARLLGPEDVYVVSGKVYVADKLNSRIMIWNSVPAGSGVAANQVFGQPDMTSSDSSLANISSAKTLYPTAISIGGGRVFILDHHIQRVLVKSSL